jgi:hypothetical protein
VSEFGIDGIAGAKACRRNRCRHVPLRVTGSLDDGRVALSRMTVAVIGQVREYRQIASPKTVVDLAPLIVHAPRMPVSSIWRQGPLASPDATHSKTRSGHGPSSRRGRFRKEMLAQFEQKHVSDAAHALAFVHPIELTVICQR